MTRKGRIILFTSSIVVIGIIISIIVTINLLNKELHSLATAEITNVDLSLVPDGVFDGQYSTLPVSAIVQISVQDNKIIAIKIVKHSNGQGQPAEVIINKVIEKQTLDVDVISGATYSSKVILKSIEDALIKAISVE